jgi:hypothetical protein
MLLCTDERYPVTFDHGMTSSYHVLSTELHATLTGHPLNISVFLFSPACECEGAGGSEPGAAVSESLSAAPGEQLLPPPLPRPHRS